LKNNKLNPNLIIQPAPDILLYSWAELNCWGDIKNIRYYNYLELVNVLRTKNLSYKLKPTSGISWKDDWNKIEIFACDADNLLLDSFWKNGPSQKALKRIWNLPKKTSKDFIVELLKLDTFQRDIYLADYRSKLYEKVV
jgi:hypothetical protein